ncbi:hypothetical protein NDU88_006109 [Pleurodeles waltl]|uniref:Uncharacterized protein n=1 Tax=Pleurodeles waltl TaxID=8319 RepID=A0AAV7PHD6_PLEWA|nr:hypothetical protein NDU88_006109 [Pleurodeles waltl]
MLGEAYKPIVKGQALSLESSLILGLKQQEYRDMASKSGMTTAEDARELLAHIRRPNLSSEDTTLMENKPTTQEVAQAYDRAKRLDLKAC